MSDRAITIGTSVLLAVLVGGLGYVGYVQHKQAMEQIAELARGNEATRRELMETRQELAKKTDALEAKIGATQEELADQFSDAQEEANTKLAAQVASNHKEVIAYADQVVAGLTAKHEKLQGDLFKAQADTNAKLAAGVDLVEKYVGGQNTILDRALGKYIPVQMPKDLEARLAGLEAQAKDETKWPKTPEDVKVFAEGLKACIKDIPAWAERDMLPRINKLRWDASAFRALAESSGPDKDAIASNCEAVLDAAFEGVPSPLVTRLGKIKDGAEDALRKEHRDAVLTAAKGALEGKGDAAKAWNDLAYLVEEKDADAVALQPKLRSKVVNDKARDQVAAMKKSLDTVKNAEDEHLRQVGYRQIAAMAVSQRLAWMEEGVLPEVIAEMKEAQGKAEQQAEMLAKNDADRKWLAYQKWALGRIEEMKKGIQWLPEFQKIAKTNPWTDAGKKEKDENMKIYQTWIDAGMPNVGAATQKLLLEINPGLLDSGVSAMYNKTWQDAWKLTEDEKTQEDVAKAAAMIPKKGLNDMEISK